MSWVRVSRLLCTYQGGFQRNLKWESQEQQIRFHTLYIMIRVRTLRKKVGNTLEGYFYKEKQNQTCCTNYKKKERNTLLLNAVFVIFFKKQFSKEKQTLHMALKIPYTLSNLPALLIEHITQFLILAQEAHFLS